MLVLLVVLSLLLLTAYFGESPNGRLHGVQRAFLTVVSPIQNGANKALKPVRDTIGWFGETLSAKGQRDKLKRENNTLRKELVAEEAEKTSLRQLQGLYHLDQLGAGEYHPVTATVVGKSPNIWYATVTIDAGSNAGVRVDDPVVNGEGLVGKVGQVASDGAQVDLITDSSMGVSARLGKSTSTGIVQPKVGEPGDLLLQYLPSTAQPNQGEFVVTSGTVSSPDDSLYPPGPADRAGDLGQRRNRLQVGQRAPGGEPAEPRRRAGADLGRRLARGQHRQPGLTSSRPARAPRPAKPAPNSTRPLRAAGEPDGNRIAAPAPGGDGGAAGVRAGGGGLGDPRVRRQRRPVPAAGGVRGAAVRVDDRSRVRVHDRSADRPAAAADARA